MEGGGQESESEREGERGRGITVSKGQDLSMIKGVYKLLSGSLG